MAVLPAVLATALGTALGVLLGGSVDRLRSLRLRLTPVGAGGVVAASAGAFIDRPAALSVAVEALAMVGLLAFALANIRLGGMVVLLAGLCFELVPVDRIGAVGDTVTNVGLALVAASALRCRTVRRLPACDYVRKIAPLGQGPVDPSGPRSHVRRIALPGPRGEVNRPTAFTESKPGGSPAPPPQSLRRSESPSGASLRALVSENDGAVG